MIYYFLALHLYLTFTLILSVEEIKHLKTCLKSYTKITLPFSAVNSEVTNKDFLDAIQIFCSLKLHSVKF